MTSSVGSKGLRLPDLTTPTMTDAAPAPGRRVRQGAPEYQGSDIHHSLDLPTDGKSGGRFPVIHPHTDLWMHKASNYRDQARA